MKIICNVFSFGQPLNENSIGKALENSQRKTNTHQIQVSSDENLKILQGIELKEV